MTHPLDATTLILQANLLAAAHALAEHTGHRCGLVVAPGTMEGEGVYFGTRDDVTSIAFGPGSYDPLPPYVTLPPVPGGGEGMQNETSKPDPEM